MYKKNIILLIMIFIPAIMLGQFAENIRTGRPGQSIGAFALGSKVFQVQSGFTYTSFEDGFGNERNTYGFNNVFRLGIREKFEVSGVVNYTIAPENLTTGDRLSGISNTQIGARYNILEPNGAIPALGIQGRALLKFQQEEFRREEVGARFILAAGNRITDWMSYGVNYGLEWAGNGEGPVQFYTFNLGFSLTDRLGAFVEVYGQIEDFTASYDGGFSYLVNSDLRLDISAGWQDTFITNNNWFIDGGFSYRFDWRE